MADGSEERILFSSPRCSWRLLQISGWKPDTQVAALTVMLIKVVCESVE